MTAYDVVIVGGAVHGASAAYHLAAAGFGGRVLLIEKDPSFRYAATALSCGSIRQQFSTAINIEISLFGIAFLRHDRRAARRRRASGRRSACARAATFSSRPKPARRRSRGTTACRPGSAPTSSISTRAALAERFPYLATDGLAAGCFGRTGEGWFDGYALMQALAARRAHWGSRY